MATVNIPSTIKYQKGDFLSRVAGEDIPSAGLAITASASVDYGALLCDADEPCIGVSFENADSGKRFDIVKRGLSVRVKTTGTAVRKDIVKNGANGVFVADGTSGSTALSAKSVGVLATTPDANGYAWMDWI